MKKIIFVRHGESVDNVKDIIQFDDTPLTEKGKNDGQKIAQEIFDNFSPTLLITSTSLRAFQTAEIILGSNSISLSKIISLLINIAL